MNEDKLQAKAIIFDLDNTLLNSLKAQNNAVLEFKNAYKCFDNTDNAQFTKIWEDISEEAYDYYIENKIPFESMRMERMKRLFALYSVNLSEQEANNRFKRYLELYEKNWTLYDGTEEVLENLKSKYKLAIISNGDGKNQRRKIEKMGLDKYFGNIFISGEVGYSKPEKEIFEFACKTMNMNLNDCIMIGDKYKTDIEGSINTGMKAIWVNRKGENNEYKYQLKEIKDITKFLN